MRLALHTVICCCVFTTVLPAVRGATGEPITGLKKRLREWLQGHMKRDLRSSSSSMEGVSEPNSDQQAGLHAKPLSAPSSTTQNMRPKRSTPSKSAGCFLITCVYHDLFYKLYELNNKQKEDKAPKEKMGHTGYGRRRRSILHAPERGRSVRVSRHTRTVA